VKKYVLSIITINLNNKDGLEKTIQSVINQTYKNFEYIIIDGGSTDGSNDLIKNYEKEINYWISEKDDGIYAAMNKGIKQANGEYCFFLNSGDYLNDMNSLQKIEQYFYEGFDIIFGNSNFIDPSSQKIYETSYPEHPDFRYFFKRSLSHPATIIKKKLFKDIGYFDESYKIISDWIFFYKAFIVHNISYLYIRDIISTFFYGGLSTTADGLALISKEQYRFFCTYYSQPVADYFNYSFEAINEYEKIKNNIHLPYYKSMFKLLKGLFKKHFFKNT